jgi:hypothetical protein
MSPATNVVDLFFMIEKIIAHISISLHFSLIKRQTVDRFTHICNTGGDIDPNRAGLRKHYLFSRVISNFFKVAYEKPLSTSIAISPGRITFKADRAK